MDNGLIYQPISDDIIDITAILPENDNKNANLIFKLQMEILELKTQNEYLEKYNKFLEDRLKRYNPEVIKK